mmetsp:Transcript_23556/g.64978  ORF Transcript_23556/g.64978 Transcript_23556/m.64978 type:complete len:259 (+) Transcript_23556:214-990(+)
MTSRRACFPRSGSTSKSRRVYPLPEARDAATMLTNHTPTLVHSVPQTVQIEGKRVKLQIWDTAGQVETVPLHLPLPPGMTMSHLRMRAAGAFSYDYASVLQGRHGHLAHIRAIAPIHTQKGTGRCLRATYTSLYTSSYISSHISPQDVTNSKTLQNVRNWVRNIEGNAPQTVNKILVGNKCDMESERQVPRADGEKLASEYGIKFYETSARSNTNVSEAFLTLATDVVARLVANGGETSNSGLSVGQTRQGAKNSPCC